MAEYKSRNNGLLQVTDVKEGDKIVLMEPAYETFSEAKQRTYWNCKVKLPDGKEKLAGLMDSTCDAFAAKWGSNTDNWSGRTAVVNLKIAKNGNPYITLVPLDTDKVEVAEQSESDTVNPADIPF